MGDQIVASVTAIFTAIAGVAIIAVLVSKNANTSQVISAGGSAFSMDLGTALSPVTGGSGFTSYGSGSIGSGSFQIG